MHRHRQTHAHTRVGVGEGRAMSGSLIRTAKCSCPCKLELCSVSDVVVTKALAWRKEAVSIAFGKRRFFTHLQ